MSSKLTSRKFWVCVAAGLAAIATGIANAAIGNEVVAGIGLACGIIAAGIYAATEAAVDVARLEADQTTTEMITTVERNVNVTSSDKETAKAVMISETNAPVMEDE